LQEGAPVTYPLTSGQPLVAVLTPVHNGADSLAACLESVRAQTYRDWIHLVVDNASTDRTRDIAESFAAKDARVSVLSFRELLPMFENFNRALLAVPSDARFLKQLHADDTLHPDCLLKMVVAAQNNPDVALVVSRFYRGSTLSPTRAPRRAVRLPGPTVAKGTVLGTSNVLGSPSVPLMRIDRLAGWPSLFRVDRYPPEHPNAPPHNQGDKESCLDTLARWDVAFLPEPLVYLRDGGPSATGFVRRVGGWHATRLDLLLRRGKDFMDEKTLRKGIRRTTWKWARAVAWRALKQFRRSDQEFLVYQRLCLEDLIPRLRAAGWTREAKRLHHWIRPFIGKSRASDSSQLHQPVS
jgi:glycosyltransferase involved in cell wall biosynthesis